MGKAHIHTLFNPVTRSTAYTTVEAGKPLSAHLRVPGDALIYRNGNEYTDEPLQDGDVLNLICVPKGSSDGKLDMGKTALTIGALLTAASINPFAAGTIASQLFMGAALAGATRGIAPLNLNESGLK